MNSTADGHIDQVHGVTVHAAQDSAANAQIEAEIESQLCCVQLHELFYPNMCRSNRATFVSKKATNKAN